LAKAIFRFISRNETKGNRCATEEELLQEVVDELKDALELDLVSLGDQSLGEDFKVKYLTFVDKANKKADWFKNKSHNYRQICSLPSFALGLVMASRIPSHYTHAPWFRIKALMDMMGVHGSVSKLVGKEMSCGRDI
jgi:hypothetical protein